MTAADAAGRVTHVPMLKGELYTEVLKRLHALLKPRTYFEIGSYTGDSLALARGKALVVDPNFGTLRNVFAGKTECHLFQMTSDAFFRDHDPAAILREPIDLAFLDGMHLFEFLLRDFANTERFCRPNSIIALHDCLPIDVYITERAMDAPARQKLSTQPDWWTGDVWKLLPILRRYRPELRLLVLDAPPTGLVLITGLDPRSRVLNERYFEICAEYEAVTLLDYGIERLFSETEIHSTRGFVTLEDLSRRFWL